jgi:Domain of unknown function (DUF397)
MARKISWRKSSYSGGQGGNCVEVADRDSRVLVRDTTDRQGPILRFTADAWKAFAKQLKSLASGTLAAPPIPGGSLCYSGSQTRLRTRPSPG